MASASANKNGQYSVQFTLHKGKKRDTMYLGKVPRRWAEEFADHVGRLIEAQRFGELPARKTQRWLQELHRDFRAKLSAHGLADAVRVGTIAELCAYEISNAHVKPSTLIKYEDAEFNLTKYFGADRLLHQISAGDVESFHRWLLKHGSRKPKPDGPLAPTTADGRCKQARSFFNTAVKHRWIDENPFEVLELSSAENPDAQVYVELAKVEAILKLASPELQLMIACSRFGGIRTMSEMRALRWEWVNFPEGKVTVMAPKNERYKHKKWRVVPMYPSWRPYLEAAHAVAPTGAEYLLSTGRDLTDSAYRNRLERVCLRAGELPWPSLWHSMRGSRATDLIDEGFPEHVVCEWQNCSPKTLRRHYLQVTKDHYAQAIAARKPADSATLQRDEPDAADSLQNSL